MPATPIHKNEKGQVAIEFILVIGFALGVIFLFVSQTFNSTDGYLVHYANFMASRTYLTVDRGSNTVETNINYARSEAEETFNTFPLDTFNIKADFEVITFNNKGNGLFSGTTATFEKTLNFFSTIGGGDKAKMVSESFLGKEPTRVTCLEMICQALAGQRRTCADKTDEMDATLYDNGC